MLSMGDEISYFFSDRPLETVRAIEALDQRQEKVDGRVASGDQSQAPVYAVLQVEKEALAEYCDQLEPYHQFVDEAYQDFEIPGSYVLERVEEDMSMMAKERDERLEQNVFTGESRKEALNQIMPEGLERPVMSDTWAIMQEAQGLREYTDRRV